jgi:hypothetical protein
MTDRVIAFLTFSISRASLCSISINCVDARKVFTRLKITNLSNVAMTKLHNNIPPDGNHRKTVDDTHSEPQDDQSRHKFSECSKPNEKEAIHLEQLLTFERKKLALSQVRAAAAAKMIKSGRTEKGSMSTGSLTIENIFHLPMQKMVMVEPLSGKHATALHIKKLEHQLLKNTKVLQNELCLQEVARVQEVGTVRNKVTIKAYKNNKNKKLWRQRQGVLSWRLQRWPPSCGHLREQ